MNGKEALELIDKAKAAFGIEGPLNISYTDYYEFAKLISYIEPNLTHADWRVIDGKCIREIRICQQVRERAS